MASSKEDEAIDGICERYKSHLDFDQLASGIVACLNNSRSLYEDASLLLNAGRFARAMALFVSCMEELGKIAVLRSMSRIPKNNQRLWKECWKDFRAHEPKATYGIIDTFPDEARSRPTLFVTAAMWQRKLSPLSERVRQFGLYVDFHARDRRWLTPAEVTAQDGERWRGWAEQVMARTEALHALGVFSAQALRIQNEVFGSLNENRPDRKDIKAADLQAIQAAAIPKRREYYRRLVEAGVLDVTADIQVQGKSLADFVAVS